MEIICTTTNATFTAANGETFRYEDLFDAIKRHVEYHSRTKGRYMREADMEDLFQEIAYKVLRAAHTFDPRKGSLAAWINRIAINAENDALDEYIRRTRLPVEKYEESEKEEGYAQQTNRFAERSRARRFAPVTLTNKDGEVFLNPSCASLSDREDWADRKVEVRETEEAIDAAVASLSERLRTVIGLARQGMTPKQIAPIIGVSAENASVLLFRARKALEKRMGESFLRENGIHTRGTHRRTTDSEQDSVVFCIFVVTTVRIPERRSIYKGRTNQENKTHDYGNCHHHCRRHHHHRPRRRVRILL